MELKEAVSRILREAEQHIMKRQSSETLMGWSPLVKDRELYKACCSVSQYLKHTQCFEDDTPVKLKRYESIVRSVTPEFGEAIPFASVVNKD